MRVGAVAPFQTQPRAFPSHTRFGLFCPTKAKHAGCAAYTYPTGSGPDETGTARGGATRGSDFAADYIADLHRRAALDPYNV